MIICILISISSILCAYGLVESYNARLGKCSPSISRIGSPRQRLSLKAGLGEGNVEHDSSIDMRKNVELYKSISTKVEKKMKTDYSTLTKPEVLAPAGGWPQLKAAVANGADAVYFGLQEGFNARARASNFAIDEVKGLMEYLHDRDVKGYVVVNILVFDEELEKLRPLLAKLAEAGVDALIMQDVGAASIVRKMSDLPVHGSTQMSITDANGAKFAEELGIDRVVVGRELSIDEMANIAANEGTEVEAFVHGALCVSYSGQCYSSEAWGGRSANRGQCAQACRLPYGLIVNGTLTDLKDVQYLLSPQDFMAVDYVPDLIRANVKSLKIEGRLKGENYVAITTAAYRKAVDESWDMLMAEAKGDESVKFCGPNEAERRDLRQVFSRGQDLDYDGLSAGFLKGPRHQDLVRGRNPRHRGLLLGTVRDIIPGRGVVVALDGDASIKRGDGVVFEHGDPQNKEEGGSIYEIHLDKKRTSGKGEEVSSGEVMLTFGKNAVNFWQIMVGDMVWKNKDPALDNKLKAFAERDKKIELVLRVSGKEGENLVVTVETKDGFRGKGESSILLSEARSKSLDNKQLKKGIGQLTNTEFQCNTDYDVSHLKDNLFLPEAEIKLARRLAIEDLIEARKSKEYLKHEVHRDNMEGIIQEIMPKLDLISESELEPKLSLLCRTPKQVEEACKVPWLEEIVLDFLEIHGLRESVVAVRNAGKKVVVATPRIIKPEEEKMVLFYIRLKTDALLVRSAGLLQQLKDLSDKYEIPELFGDFSLNAANAVSSRILLDKGLTRLTPTHDSNAYQICEMAVLTEEPRKIEVILYQHLALFHTEHCVFCRFLSDGQSYVDCGHPCENNSVHLRGFEDGEDHLVLADQGCRNTVFNAKAQNGADFVDDFLQSGIRRFRIELVDEPAEFVAPLLSLYRDVLVKKEGAQERLSTYLHGSVQNSIGKIQGASGGSLVPSKERDWQSLKPTARR